jgi:hypothetical protein
MSSTQRVIPNLLPIPDIEMRKTLTIVAFFIAMGLGRATVKINAGRMVPAILAMKRKRLMGLMIEREMTALANLAS